MCRSVHPSGWYTLQTITNKEVLDVSIKKSIEDLPRSGDERLGAPPSRNPFLGEALAEYIVNYDDPAHPKDLALAIPEAGPYRASFASKRCDRALYYGLTGQEKSNPPGPGGEWTFLLGHQVHDLVQKFLPQMNGEVEDMEFEGVEVEADLNAIGIPGSAHVDAVIAYKGKRLAVEIKSINGFGFKKAATTFSGPPEGPRSGHVLQSAMAAKALGLDGVVLIYLSLEQVSPRLAATYSDSEVARFTAEWHYTIDELDSMIETEVARIKHIMANVSNESVPPRRLIDHGIPEGATITDPSSGMWVVTEQRDIIDTGSTWMCNYCDWQDTCIAAGAEG